MTMYDDHVKKNILKYEILKAWSLQHGRMDEL